MAPELLLVQNIHYCCGARLDDIGKLAAIAAASTVLNYFLERDLKSWQNEKDAETDLNEEVVQDSKLPG
ncbi:DUF1622 domain-containing protein [Ilyomonas limi]|uniref:DUF1622 domain-containing protein n=1 Tax=Ilyomonas limi TaxID=2575867 RepID=A0A4U3L288_9BACT|nr:DUF1622 domain-containing protein [Ilyomonas limi]TKK69010.1 DUF1622 domain-containing protein [Ilyomonas limi]